VEASCQYNEASGFGRSGIPRLYVLRYHKPRSPDRDKAAVTDNGHVDQGSARRAEAHCESGNPESGNRESHGHKHYVIANVETPMG
jgi:hypothetical protein